ncbi:hypothetical protein [Thiocapsa bogorovii]|uniref:hypothetical protein n=1 Tax=Thiocapsa bogorovii TaxID=521689 RepID=UPI001E4AEB9A|nr:hypothetical protein [Thiocapsa bogorovii]UHD14292.1 hypothetical protein LT988_13340 [Thiocapsa bogorovii]
MLIDQDEGLGAAVRAALPTALPFCIITMAAGFIVGSVARLPSEDRFTLLIEFSTRNLGLVAIMGAMVMGQVKLVLFATLVFLIELPLVLILIAMRPRPAEDRNKTRV